jgi:hypothetical protein
MGLLKKMTMDADRRTGDIPVAALVAAPATAATLADIGARRACSSNSSRCPSTARSRSSSASRPAAESRRLRRIRTLLPTGARLWGRPRWACAAGGATWTAYVPVQIRSTGRRWSPPARWPADAASADDFASNASSGRNGPGVLAVAPDQAHGRVATRGIQPGEALRATRCARCRYSRPASDQGRLRGPGFLVNTEGRR